MKEDKQLLIKKDCVMCGSIASVKVYETNEPLCENCYKNNLEARRRTSL
jgi:hypothetical protein